MENGQVGTIETYRGSINSLKKFAKREVITFEEVTLKFLEKYEKWIYSNGKSPTTVGIYLKGVFLAMRYATT